jgi:hypothetical protein
MKRNFNRNSNLVDNKQHLEFEKTGHTMVHYEKSHNKEMKVILTNGGKVDHYDEQIEIMLNSL